MIQSWARDPLLHDGETQKLRFDVVSFSREQGIERCERIVPGQPLALELWDAVCSRGMWAQVSLVY